MKKIIALFIVLTPLLAGNIFAQNCSDRIKNAVQVYEKYKTTHDKQALEAAKNILNNVKTSPGVTESCVKDADRLLKSWSSNKKSTTGALIQYEPTVGVGVNYDYLEFEGEGDENGDIRVTCNESWVISNKNDWFKAEKDGNYINVICNENSSKSERTGKFYVLSASGTSSVTVTVKQLGIAASLAVAKENLKVGENAKCYTVSVTSTDDWTAEVVDGENWCKVEKKNPKELEVCVEDNIGKERTAEVRIKIDGIEKKLTVEQGEYGYKGIAQSYFETLGGDWKTTRFFVDLYALQSFGFRIGGLAKRWKYVEFSLLDFDVELASRNFKNWRVRVDWEPMVRGYLPISRRDRCWSLFAGVGASVNLINVPLNLPKSFTYFKENCFVFELGAEYYWSKKENVSSRIFYRLEAGPMYLNGLSYSVPSTISTIGISFDLYEWHSRFSRKQK